MIKVGITGGIGSGKTHICEIFRELGVPIYNADDRAKYLMQNDSNLKQSIIAEFGEEVYISGKLNRPYLAQLVFKNKNLLQKLNELVHPVVAIDVETWNAAHKEHPYTIKEAALLFETNSFKQLDKTILVHAEENERILRVMQRDQVSKDKVLDRMRNQMEDLDKMGLADFIIHNDGKREVEKIVHRIHSYFSNTGIN